MVHLYISDSTAKIGLSRNRITLLVDDKEVDYPANTVDSISIFGRPYMSAAFMFGMTDRDIDIYLFSADGHYRGHITGPRSTYAPRLRDQVHRSDDRDFALAVAKNCIAAKIRNQRKLLEAHIAELGCGDFSALDHSLEWLPQAESIAEVSGFEGNAAKGYFTVLARIVPPDFTFEGRSTRPPKDAFNSMISLGYSLLYKNIIGAIERHGLDPHIGFLHQDSRNHATLASDLIEPWRAPIIDDTVLGLLANGTVNPDDFTRNSETGAVYGSNQTTRSIVKAFGQRILRPAKYLEGDPKQYGFQYALDLQIDSLVRAIEANDPALFSEIEIVSFPAAAVTIAKDQYFNLPVDVNDDSEHEAKTLVLVIYDISNDARRTKFADLCGGFGFRVQWSAFEAMLTRRHLAELLAKIDRFASDEDNIRIYKIRGSGAVTFYGDGKLVTADDTVFL